MGAFNKRQRPESSVVHLIPQLHPELRYQC